MSTSCGFFNSLNHDRKYNASHFGKCFEGIILDGILASIGDCFVVKANSGMTVTIGSGKSWYLASWLLNDADLPMTLDSSDVVLGRIDAIVMEFDATETTRWNDIKIIKGASSSVPTRPTLKNTNVIKQIPLCYINVRANATSITQADITNMVGTADCPFVTGILQTVSLDTLLGQWENELDQFVDDEKAEYDIWFEQMKADLRAEQAVLDEWIATEQEDFLAWFTEMKGKLGDDAAGSLQLQIDREAVNRILLSGFADGKKVFSDDGTQIVSTASDGRTLTKTFTNGFLTMTTVLKSATGGEVARMVKTFDTTGKVIDIVTTYI